MGSLFVLLVVLGCVAYQYFKGTLFKSFAGIIIAICATVAAFGYFEFLAGLLIGRDIFVPWSYSISFLLLFVLALAILHVLAGQLTRKTVDLGVLAERIGRVVCGIFQGLIISGALIAGLAMAPLSNKIPYQRFDKTASNIEKPKKVLFNADGFATGWFNLASKGSLSGKRSFGVLHPNFLNQMFLNRHIDSISAITSSDAIQVSKTNAAWTASSDLKGAGSKPLPQKSGHTLTIVRIGITKNAVKKGGTFTLSQLRLVCNKKSRAKTPLAGKGKVVYPAGYLRTPNELQMKKPSDQIRLEIGDIKGKAREIDFAFYVPNDYMPVLAEFKQNSVAEVPRVVAADQAPEIKGFIPISECTTDIAQVQRIKSAKIFGIELAARGKLLSGLTLIINDPNDWQDAQTERSIRSGQFEDGQLNCVRAELQMEKPAGWDAVTKKAKPKAAQAVAKQPAKKTFAPPKKRAKRKRRAKGIRGILQPRPGYKVISLKCNNPSGGAAIPGVQLPVLIEQSGLVHHAVGVIASAEVDDEVIYELDYCSVSSKDTEGGIVIAEDGTVRQAFPEAIWITEQAKSIHEFYVLYLVESGRDTIITEVGAGDSQASAGFTDVEGFLIK